MRRHLIASLVLLLPIAVYALPPGDGSVRRHYILESTVPLDAAASADLAAQGIEIQKPLANHRYLVRMSDDVTPPNDARIRSLSAFDASRKIARAAYAEAAKGTTSRLRILFQPDVTFQDAQRAVYAAGGTVDTPFALPSAGPQRLIVRLPSMSVMALARDERVFGIYGPPLIPKSLNAVAASISKVTPLFSAPYNLNGSGVVLSIFEPDGPPDVNHFEFSGRVTSHFPAGVAADRHATHTSGTLVAVGTDPRAKGMAPAATLHAFTAFPTFPDGDFDSDTFFQTKRDGPKAFGSIADSNSWDFAFSWQTGNVWFGNEDGYGAYSGLESEPYDAIMRASGEPLTVHAAGNDATAGNPSLSQPWSPHRHIEDQDPVTGVYKHTYCYSQDGTGNDCPAGFGCSTGTTYCEKTKHPTHGADTTIGLMASTKNSVTVGALNPDGLSIASFSSHGPTTDGRVKPELVAKGTDQFSTVLANGYDALNGTSMATPVVAGMSALLTQQYRKTFGKTPSGSILKTLLIAGADDLGPAGPDYTYGFGLADAKASVDLIIADGATGSRIRTGTIMNRQDVDIPVVIPATAKFRIVLGWFDPEVLLIPNPDDPDPLAAKTLVNDLDVRVIDPSGATLFPYALNGATPSALATKAANHTDTTEEVEIANAVAGTYHILVHGAIGDPAGAAQDYVVVTNAGTALAACSDAYEPNDTQDAAFGSLMNGQTISAKICNPIDVDYFTFTSNSLSPLSATVTATDTPLKVTLSSAFATTVTKTIAAGTSAKLDSVISTLISPTPNVQFFVRVEQNGAIGATGAYTLTPTFSFNSTPRKRGAKH